jgi:beta-lactamase class A
MPRSIDRVRSCRSVPVRRLFIAWIALVGAALAQGPVKQQALWQKLETSIHGVDRNLDGVMGVAIEDLSNSQTLFLQPDEVFPQASSIKIAVLAELYRQAQQG